MATTITYTLNQDGTLRKTTVIDDVIEDFATVDEELGKQRDAKKFYTNSRDKANEAIDRLTIEKDELNLKIAELNTYIDTLVILKNQQ